MAKSKKTKKSAKPTVKVQDLAPQENPKGGSTARKAGTEQQEYLIVKLKDVFIS
jgi:hypothetical protein